jgi:hypothetical protein
VTDCSADVIAIKRPPLAGKQSVFLLIPLLVGVPPPTQTKAAQFSQPQSQKKLALF